METILKRVGLLLDAQKECDSPDFPAVQDVGRPMIQEVGGGSLSDDNGSCQETKTLQEREEEILQFLAWLEELQEFNPEAFNAVIAHGGSQMGEKGERDNADIKKELSLLLDYLRTKTNNDTMNSHGARKMDMNFPGSAERPPPVPGIKVKPTPGFTLKTTCLNDESKVFINICSHKEISAPSMKKRLNDVGEEVEGMNIPMSVGPPHPCRDKSGVVCVAYDVIVSPKVLESSTDDRTGQYKDFVCRLGIQSIQQKLKGNERFDQRYKIAERSSVHGR